MEIPGLTRLQSPSEEPSSVQGTKIDEVLHEPCTTNDTEGIATTRDNDKARGVSHIDAGLAAKIEAMRAQIKQKSVNQEVQSPIVETPAPTPGTVNFSILDKALADHGFETMPDSDEEMQEQDAESSVSSDSSDSSDVSSDSDDESDASMDDSPLTAEERERILIAADNEGPVSTEVPRTKNEIAEDEEPVKVPDFEITSDEVIEPLGTITSIVGSACVVTGTPTPETKVLDVGTLLVFDDRKNLGYIADTFGPVILPMFTVRFTSIEALHEAGVLPGTMVYVVPKHARYVFSDTLRIKGTDASNINDEEQSETEFSDDEKEAAYKSQKKNQKKAERQGMASQREVRPLNDLESIAMAQGLTYDPRQNRVHMQSSPQSFESAPRNFTGPNTGRGRGNNRGQPSNRRGRPENNNYGRGPASTFVSSSHGQAPEPSQAPFQRTFYQAEVAVAPTTAQSNSAAIDSTAQRQNMSVTTPALYQPLKRPTT